MVEHVERVRCACELEFSHWHSNFALNFSFYLTFLSVLLISYLRTKRLIFRASLFIVSWIMDGVGLDSR